MTCEISCRGVWTGHGPPAGPALISVEDGRITRIDHLSGRGEGPFAMPSFVDAHCHFSWTGLQAVTLDLSKARSAPEMLHLLEAEASGLPQGSILRAEGMEETSWDVPGLPSLETLDAATPENPAFVRRVCGHAVLVNSMMMRLLRGSLPELDRSTGLILEGIALELDSLFPPERELLEKAFEAAEGKAFSSGLTAVASMEPVSMLTELASDPPRIGLAAGVIVREPGELSALKELRGHGIPRLLGRKLFLDGSIGARTASLAEGYIDGYRPEPILSSEELEERIREGTDASLPTIVHAIGGRALGLLDSVCARLLRSEPDALKFGIRVEHAEELLPAWPGSWNSAVTSFCMQPNFVNRWQRRNGLYQSVTAGDSYRSLNPFATVLKAGFRLGFGSDSMPLGPLDGLAGATGHPDPAQRLDTEQALHAYTLGAAAMCGFTELESPLGPGRTADMVFLSENPFLVEEWESIEVVRTMKSGVDVFMDGEVVRARY